MPRGFTIPSSLKMKNSEVVTRTVTIQNTLGLHARAAASFVKTAFQYEAEIELIKGNQRANGKSIMALLTLAATQGSSLQIEAIGSDSNAAVAALAELVDNKFGEE